MILKSTLKHFLDLFFPQLCIVCKQRLISQEKFLCLKCQLHIPKTNFHNQPNNTMEQLFYGRVPIERATAFFEFQKGSDYQKILHQLKYQGQKQLGERMGWLHGIELRDSEFASSIDFICPVPLHPKREKKRGYNQSQQLANGLGSAMNKPIRNDILVRAIHTKTQTRKNRFERWQNVDGIFELTKPEEALGKHILLIDDVVTTGATLEACAAAIKKCSDAKISIITLAIA